MKEKPRARVRRLTNEILETRAGSQSDVQAVVLRGLWMDALCLVFPNGQAVWVEASTSDYWSRCVAAWKDAHPEYKGTPATMGAVQVRMPCEVFEGMQTTNEFPWPT